MVANMWIFIAISRGTTEVGLLLKYHKKNVPSAPHHSLTQIARGLWESNWTKPFRISKVLKNYEIHGYNIKKNTNACLV